MPRVTILRCPVSPVIGDRVRWIAAALIDELGINPWVIDGFAGEFIVSVSGREVYRKAGDDLPTVEQVLEAVRGTVPAGG